jgi:phosphonate transport system substrate-binding protein
MEIFMIFHSRLCLLSLMLLPMLVCAEPLVAPLTVAVVPQFTSLQVHKDWTPFLERLSRDSGVPLKLKVYQRIPGFEADMLKGAPDLVFMNPYHQVMAKRAAGYMPLVRDNNPLTGILLVRRDSPVKTIKNLAGEKLAFPAPNAFAASLYMRALLVEQEGIKFDPIYVNTHSNVFRQIILGDMAAGGTTKNSFKREPDAVTMQLRVLFETPGVAPHPFAAHPRVSKAQRKALVDAILHLREDATAAPLLQGVQMPEPVVADYVRDYQPLERLKLEKYLVIEKD